MMGREFSERERYWVIGGGVAAVLLLLVAFVVMPYLNALDRMQIKKAKARELIATLTELQPEVTRLRGALGGQTRSSANGSLTSLMEATAAQLALRERLISLRPQPVPDAGELAESLEVEIEKLRLEELVRWLYMVDMAPGGQRVNQLRLRKRFDNKELFDASLVLVRYRAVER